jgi:arylsulfatase A-like enzyme
MEEGPMTAERYRSGQGYFGQITEMDHSLGKLFEALESMGFRENTYIVFTSDNGLFRGDHGFMSKALHYEESIRVPMFIVGPGIESGYDDSLVTNADIAPTLLDLAGIQVPDSMHGKSLKKVLLEQQPLEREYVLFELPDANKVLETRPCYSLRSSRWKYIQTFEDGKHEPYTFEELYDLQVDRFEMSNLANHPKYKDLLNQLRLELNWQRAAFSN